MVVEITGDLVILYQVIKVKREWSWLYTVNWGGWWYRLRSCCSSITWRG